MALRVKKRGVGVSHKQRASYPGTTMFWLRNARNPRILTLNLAFQVTTEIYVSWEKIEHFTYSLLA